MTDTEKLVERLREQARCAWERCDSVAAEAFEEAADRLEAMAEEVKAMRRAGPAHADLIKRGDEAVDRLAARAGLTNRSDQ